MYPQRSQNSHYKVKDCFYFSHRYFQCPEKFFTFSRPSVKCLLNVNVCFFDKQMKYLVQWKTILLWKEECVFEIFTLTNKVTTGTYCTAIWAGKNDFINQHCQSHQISCFGPHFQAVTLALDMLLWPLVTTRGHCMFTHARSWIYSEQYPQPVFVWSYSLEMSLWCLRVWNKIAF